MKILTLILPYRANTPIEQMVLSIVRGKQDQDAQQVLQDLTAQIPLQIERTTVTLTLTGKKQLTVELAGEFDVDALLLAGRNIYSQKKIDHLRYQDTEQQVKAGIRGMWWRTWL